MNQLLNRFLLFVAGNLMAFNLFAHQDEEVPIRFIENKGQWEDFIQYTADIPGGRLFLEEDQLTFTFCDLTQVHDRWFFRKPDESIEFPVDCHAFTLKFQGGNPQAQIQAADPEADYYNYFLGNDPDKWASKAKAYSSIRYQEIYPGIDFVLYTDHDELKYDFLVRPGADPNQIRMEFEGLESLFLHAGQLHLNTSLNKIIDERPISFQGANQTPTEFVLQDNQVSFVFPDGYDSRQELRIDPTLIFSTFTGSTANNFGFTATYDRDGNLFAGGIAFGPGYPVTPGAYQINFIGGFDISITKFDPSGQLLWSTYIGGSLSDQPHSMITDFSGDLYIYGRSNSTNYAITANAYDTTPNGGYDIIVTRLAADGSILLGSTYIGGNDNDGMNKSNAYVQQGIKYNYADDARGEIVLDDQEEVYIATCTQSPDFPATPGAFQVNMLGQQDGCVFKLSPDMSTLIYATYLGGTGDDAAYSLKVNDQNEVYVTGGTESLDFPTAGNVVTPTAPGGIDGFITQLNAAGTGLVRSTYIGNANYNQCYFIELDGEENVYVFGQKTGNWNVFPAGIWSTPNGGGQFLAKLDNNLSSYIYSTEFGTVNSTVNISPTAFLVDVCGFIYMSGWGGATNFFGTTTGLPTSANALQSTTDGADLYLLVLQPDAVGIEYATFMGGTASNEHVDGGTSRFNKRSEVYQSVCAGCQGNSDFPTTPNAVSPTNNSVGCNLACFKLDLDAKGVIAEFRPDPDTAGCAPQFIQFINQSEGGNQYFWNFGDNTTSTQFSPSHNYPNPGNYVVTLVAVDSTTCNIADTVERTITVLPLPIAAVTPDTSVCEGESIQLAASGGTNYTWSPPLYLNQTSGASVLSSPAGNVSYEVIVSNGSCEDTTQVNLTVLPPPTADAEGDTLICPGDTISIGASGGGTYVWSPSNTLSSGNAPTPQAFPTATTDYTVLVTAPNGCTDEDTVRIEVSAISADAGGDIDLCIGDSVQLSATGNGTFDWFPPTNLSQTTIANPVADPVNDITYVLTVTNALGCTAEDSVAIVIRPLPIVGAGPDELICDNDTVQLNASGALVYNWTPGTGLSNPGVGNPFASPIVPTNYVVLGIDQFGCEDDDTVFVDVIPAPVAEATGGTRICQDSSIQLSATGGITYLWTPAVLLDDATSPNPIATPGSTTTFTVTVFASNGCDDQDTVVVPVTPRPVVDIVGDDLVCLGNRGRLLGSGAETYLWSTGATANPIVVTPPGPTVYTLTGFVDGCPSLPDSFFMDVDDILPIADFYADPDSGFMPFTTTFFNLSTDAISYLWNFDDGTYSDEFQPTHSYGDTGRFEVRLIAIDENGCIVTATQRVIVGADFSIFVPNAFTPNNDGTNDFFSTPWFGVREFHIMIFDRWGMLIFESFDPDFKWDGFYKDKNCQEGVYTYVIEASGYVGEKVKRAGTVTLYR